jgi:hypothetical protein
MVDFTAAENDASRMTRLMEGSSRMESTSCSSSTLTARSGCCATLGHTRRRCACVRRIKDPGLGVVAVGWQRRFTVGRRRASGGDDWAGDEWWKLCWRAAAVVKLARWWMSEGDRGMTMGFG